MLSYYDVKYKKRFSTKRYKCYRGNMMLSKNPKIDNLEELVLRADVCFLFKNAAKKKI